MRASFRKREYAPSPGRLFAEGQTLMRRHQHSACVLFLAPHIAPEGALYTNIEAQCLYFDALLMNNQNAQTVLDAAEYLLADPDQTCFRDSTRIALMKMKALRRLGKTSEAVVFFKTVWEEDSVRGSAFRKDASAAVMYAKMLDQLSRPRAAIVFLQPLMETPLFRKRDDAHMLYVRLLRREGFDAQAYAHLDRQIGHNGALFRCADAHAMFDRWQRGLSPGMRKVLAVG